MSIKLYNGYKLPNMSALELKNFFDDFRAKLKVEAEEKFIKRLAKDYSELVDLIYLGNVKEENYKAWFKECRMFHEERSMLGNLEELMIDKFGKILNTRQRNPSYDFSCQVSIIPVQGYILCQVFEDSNEFLKTWESMKGVEEFGYWDNTDHPNNVSDEAWDLRYQTWKTALNDFSAPAECGFTFEFMPSEFSLTHLVYNLRNDEEEFFKKILSQIPSYEFRLERWSRDKTRSQFMKRFQEERKIEGKRFDSISESGYFDAVDYLETEEGKKETEEVKQKMVLPFLKEELTEYDLKLKFHDIMIDDNEEKK
jgi:hypothetical protein